MLVEVFDKQELSLNSETSKPIFFKLKQEEAGVYGVICPQKNRYTPEQILEMEFIPERIKEIVTSTKDIFARYDIWESSSSEEKDPILIGRKATKDDKGELRDHWYDENYLLARWGEELKPFAELKKKAIEIFSKRYKIALLKCKAQIDSQLSDVQLFCEEKVIENNIGVPYLNI